MIQRVKQPHINWKGEPEEIKTKLPPVKLLDDMLPEPLARWLLDMSYHGLFVFKTSQPNI